MLLSWAIYRATVSPELVGLIHQSAAHPHVAMNYCITITIDGLETSAERSTAGATSYSFCARWPAKAAMILLLLKLVLVGRELSFTIARSDLCPLQLLPAYMYAASPEVWRR